MESGWSESLSRFWDDMNLWLIVRGHVELYTLDRNRMPHLQQNIIVFPAPPAQAAAQQLVLTREEIFGGHVFQGQDPNDQFVFSIDLLREKATDALRLMNLVPA
ncbi:hypothetical protein DTO169C6_4742 [Paecilomyces variotii]|nr:hypothetical protein DTO169C6_4742 [Paecilomyces variotii]